METFNKVFYCYYFDDEVVEGNKPISVEKSKVLNLIDRLFIIEESFIGFTDSTGMTIQFLIQENDTALLDIPSPEQNGRYQKTIDKEYMIELIKSLSEPFKEYIESENLEFKKCEFIRIPTSNEKNKTTEEPERNIKFKEKFFDSPNLPKCLLLA